MASTSSRIYGLQELDATLSLFAQSTRRGIGKRAAIDALTPMRDAARHNVERGDHRIAESIEVSDKLTRSIANGSGQRVSNIEVYMGPTKGGYPEAMVAEFGSPPHVIEPKSAGVLSFISQNVRVFAGRVQHPGSPPIAYMRRAWDGGKDELLTLLAKGLWDEIVATAQRVAHRYASSQS